jgi:Domain of unknown function (DUF4389)
VSVASDHAVQVAVRDDLARSRLTVFFRILLAIPHLIWLILWTIAAFFAAIAIWFATLVSGTPPVGLHGFLAAYVRYQMHVYAYLTLAANPYPGFTGEHGSYPIDVAIPGPERQSRWTVGFRIFLAIPALILTAALIPTPSAGRATRGEDGYETGGGGVLAVVAFLGWFASLVTGRMPHGLRNFAVYGLRYNAETTSYLFLLTGRYPNSDPVLPAEAGTPPERPIRIRVEDDLRRSRLTVFFRLLLTLPHLVWLVLWSIAAFVAGFVAWLVALVIGRVPAGLHRFLAAWVRYGTHVYAYLSLAANPFPGFTGTAGTYPVDLEIDPPAPQRRLVTLFRFPLAIPALFLEGALSVLAFIAAFFGWFASLVTGRMPLGFRNVIAWYLRYAGQTTGYLFLLTERYPYSGPPVEEPEPEAQLEPEPEPALEEETPALDA